MIQRLIVLLAMCLFLLGCANRAVLYTEQGLVGVERVWDGEYHHRLEVCKAQHAPRTPGAEQCFGPTYDLDMKIGIAVRLSVAVLRIYWTARAAG